MKTLTMSKSTPMTRQLASGKPADHKMMAGNERPTMEMALMKTTETATKTETVTTEMAMARKLRKMMGCEGQSQPSVDR